MSNQLKLITFSLNNQSFALPIESVLKVLRAVEITPVSEVNKNILGIININDEIIPVLNSYHILNLKEQPLRLSDHFILINHTKKYILIVDNILDIVEYNVDEAAASEDYLLSSKKIKKIIKQEDRLILLLDVNELMREEDLVVEH